MNHITRIQGRRFLKSAAWLLMVLFFSLFIQIKPQAAVENTKNVKTVTGGAFVKLPDGWFYQLANGDVLKDRLAKIDGKIYYFDENGVRQYGLQNIGLYTYYFGAIDEGYMYRSQWYIRKPKFVYYFPQNGRMVKNRWMEIDGKTYYFNAKGKRLFGLITIDGKTCYLGDYTEGYLHTNQFILYKGNYYYCKDDGTIATGRLELNGNIYYFYDNGKAYSGKIKMDGKVCYFSSLGQLLKKGLDLDVYSDCAILVNINTGKAVFEKNADVRHANGSTTTILTALLALERASLQDIVTFSDEAAGQDPYKLYADAGERFQLEDLLYSMLLESHNDSAVAIAEHISTTEKLFVKLMNRRAKKLGCTNTYFSTASGLDTDVDHFTTCEDLSKIAIAAYKDSSFRKIINSTYHNFTNTDGTAYSVITNNQLLAEKMDGVIGMKTGYTDKAGYCFIGLVKTKKGRTYLSIVLGADTSEGRWTDSRTLLSYAYNKL